MKNVKRCPVTGRFMKKSAPAVMKIVEAKPRKSKTTEVDPEIAKANAEAKAAQEAQKAEARAAKEAQKAEEKAAKEAAKAEARAAKEAAKAEARAAKEAAKAEAEKEIKSILSAKYGIEGNFIDVDPTKVKNGRKVSNRLAGSDPAPKVKKTLIFTMSIEGEEVTKEVNEGEVIEL